MRLAKVSEELELGGLGWIGLSWVGLGFTRCDYKFDFVLVLGVVRRVGWIELGWVGLSWMEWGGPIIVVPFNSLPCCEYYRCR